MFKQIALTAGLRPDGSGGPAISRSTQGPQGQCRENGLAVMPATLTTVGLYLAARAGQRKAATLQLGLTSDLSGNQANDAEGSLA